uniref:Predicted protein n=1 Tax=Hordeum vulgare subsp. vulgare TaxID=112509 RepID=F2DMB2_HORVV|nr:predicted protein [Hordeum vulgare subsp. vulgare]
MVVIKMLIIPHRRKEERIRAMQKRRRIKLFRIIVCCNRKKKMPHVIALLKRSPAKARLVLTIRLICPLRRTMCAWTKSK